MSTFRINRIISLCAGIAVVLPLLNNNYRLASTLVCNYIVYIIKYYKAGFYKVGHVADLLAKKTVLYILSI